METIKKFWKYFLMFIVAVLLINFLTNFALRERYKEMKYEIKTESPEIKVEEFKSARTNGHLKGEVINNTGEFFDIKYLRINLFDNDGIYVGSEYKELKYFHPNETIKFDINYRYNNVTRATLEITDDKEEEQKFPILESLNIDFKEDKAKIGTAIAGFMLLHTILP